MHNAAWHPDLFSPITITITVKSTKMKTARSTTRIKLTARMSTGGKSLARKIQNAATNRVSKKLRCTRPVVRCLESDSGEKVAPHRPIDIIVISDEEEEDIIVISDEEEESDEDKTLPDLL